MALVTDSDRPQPHWQPPPTACLTASRATSEGPSLLMHPWPPHPHERRKDIAMDPPPPRNTHPPTHTQMTSIHKHGPHGRQGASYRLCCTALNEPLWNHRPSPPPPGACDARWRKPSQWAQSAVLARALRCNDWGRDWGGGANRAGGGGSHVLHVLTTTTRRRWRNRNGGSRQRLGGPSGEDRHCIMR